MLYNSIVVAELCNGSTADSDSVCEGSNPSSAANINLTLRKVRFIFRGVAQFGRALCSGRRGRRFDSCHLDHILTRILIQAESPVNMGSLTFYVDYFKIHSTVFFLFFMPLTHYFPIFHFLCNSIKLFPSSSKTDTTFLS